MRLLLALCILGGAGGFGCGGGSSGAVQKTLGTSGGVLVAQDGTTIDIPPGALTGDTTLTLAAVPNAPVPPGVVLVGTPYQIGPENQQFQGPVTLKLAWSPSRLPPGKTKDDVRIYTAPAGSMNYTSMAGSADGQIISIETTHFSVFLPGVVDSGSDCTADSLGGFVNEPACSSCLAAHCNSILVSCYGPDWRTGNQMGGSCGSAVRCICNCGPQNVSCRSQCQPEPACASNCGQPVDDCVAGQCQNECQSG